jgi:hypothetical protein
MSQFSSSCELPHSPIKPLIIWMPTEALPSTYLAIGRQFFGTPGNNVPQSAKIVVSDSFLPDGIIHA